MNIFSSGVQSALTRKERARGVGKWVAWENWKEGADRSTFERQSKWRLRTYRHSPWSGDGRVEKCACVCMRATCTVGMCGSPRSLLNPISYSTYANVPLFTNYDLRRHIREAPRWPDNEQKWLRIHTKKMAQTNLSSNCWTETTYWSRGQLIQANHTRTQIGPVHAGAFLTVENVSHMTG